jgi:hypothetical protein
MVAPHAGAWIETRSAMLVAQFISVAPHAGAWIETTVSVGACALRIVAPHAGAWIETGELNDGQHRLTVAPHAGAWIETLLKWDSSQEALVAPHAGAWIETMPRQYQWRYGNGRPSRRGVDRNVGTPLRLRTDGGSPLTQGRGSKQAARMALARNLDVAPHAGAWIETLAQFEGFDLFVSPLTQGRGSKPVRGGP